MLWTQNNTYSLAENQLLSYFIGPIVPSKVIQSMSSIYWKWNSQKNATYAFFCECIWVKPSCKSITTKKEALLRVTIFSFSAQTHFQWECMGHFYTSIKSTIFKIVRRLDTTWNFARSITTHSSTEPHTLYPDVSIPEYIMTTAGGRSYC